MSKYINGYRVIKELDIEGFELVKLAKEGKLQPFSKNGRRICDIRIKEKIEKQDNCVLYLKRLELGSYMTGPVYNNRGVNPNSRAAVEKVRLEYEIKALEKKGAVPLSFDQALPEEYRNCLWERFELPASEQMAAKIIERFKSFLYLRAEVDELKEDQPVSKEIKTEEGFQFQGKPRPVDLSTAGEDKEDSIEDNVKKIQLRYENDEQFRIKFPGKSFKPCTYDHLGCRDENTAQFELLLKTIRDGFIHLPIVIDRKNFKRGCEKLLNFIRKQYFPSLPEDFKIWEKDGNNNFRLIFSGYMDDVFDPKKKFEKMSEDSLLKTLEDLVARRNRILSEAKTKGEQSQLSAEIDIQIADAWCAARDKNLSKEKIENLLSQIKDVESLVEKIKGDYFDEHMSEETDKQVDFLKSDGLSLTNEP